MSFNLYSQEDKQPDYLGLAELRNRIQNPVGSPVEQTQGIDMDNPLFSVMDLPKPINDEKRQEQRKRQASFSLLGRAFGNVADGMTLGLGGRVAKREKSDVPEYVEDYLKYNDDFQKRNEDYNYKQYLEKLRAGTAINTQQNKDRQFTREGEQFNEVQGLNENKFVEDIRKSDADRLSREGISKDLLGEKKRQFDLSKVEQSFANTTEGQVQQRRVDGIYSQAVQSEEFVKSHPTLFKRSDIGSEKFRIIKDADGDPTRVPYFDQNNEPMFDKPIIADAYAKWMAQKQRIGSRQGGTSFPTSKQSSPTQNNVSPIDYSTIGQ